jgi:putative PIN family toxin of toxin-antitoxin system
VGVRAVVDNNVWVSSLLNPAGRPALLRKSFEEDAFHLIISEPLIEELADVLSRPWVKDKYGITDEDVEELLELIEDKSEHVLLSGVVNICNDRDDDLVIETALKGKTKYLVTGDSDITQNPEVLLFLSKHDVSVISIAEFLNIIEKT